MSSLWLWFLSLVVLALFVMPLVMSLASTSRDPTSTGSTLKTKTKSNVTKKPKIIYDTALAHFKFEGRVDELWSSNEGPLVQQTIVISGKHCTDRLESTLSELKQWKNLGKVSHLHAIWRPNGAEGCMQSHIAALRLAAASGKNTLVVEDDFTTTVSSESFDETQRQLQNSVGGDRWDMLIVSLFAYDWAPVVDHDPLMRIFRTTTTGAYLISGAYAAKLRDHWEAGHLALRAAENSGNKDVWQLGKTEIDQSWSALSRKDRWYSTVQSMAQQRPGVTTIAGTFSDNSWTTTPDRKHFMYRGAGEKHKKFPMRLRQPVTIHRIGVVLPSTMSEPERQAMVKTLWPHHYVVCLPVTTPSLPTATKAKDAFNRYTTEDDNEQDALALAQKHNLGLAVALTDIAPTDMSPPMEILSSALKRGSSMVWYEKWKILVGTPSLVTTIARKCLVPGKLGSNYGLDANALSIAAAQFGAQTL